MKVSDHLWDKIRNDRAFFEGYIEEVREAQRERDAEIADNDSEPEGECPISGLDPSILALAAVRATKKSIATAIRQQEGR